MKPINRGIQFETETRPKGINEGLVPYRLGMRVGEFTLDLLAQSDSPWYESEEEIEALLKEARLNRRRLKRIQLAMDEHLTRSQIEVLRLRFFDGLNLRQIGVVINRDPSSVHRKIQRAVTKLQKIIQSQE